MKYSVTAFLLLAALSAAQQVKWSRAFAYSGTHELDVAVDSRDNIIFAAEPWVWKFDSGGRLLWEERVGVAYPWSRDGSDYCVAIDVAVDSQDNVLVGRSTSDSTWVVRKLSPAGESIWTWTKNWHHSSPPLLDLGTAGDQVLVTGMASDLGWYFLELSPAGDTEWSRMLPSGPAYALSTSICAGRSSDFVVGGWDWGPGLCTYPKFLRYSRKGDSLGAATYFRSVQGNFFTTQVSTDRFGDFVVVGNCLISGPASAFLLKSDRNTELRWTWLADTTLLARSCRTDTSGYIYIAGGASTPDHVSAVQLRCFSPNGNTVWAWFYPLYGAQWTAMDLDHQGNLIFADRTRKGSNDSAYLVKVALPPVGVAERPNRVQTDVEPMATLVSPVDRDRLLAPREGQDLYDVRGRRVSREQGLGSISAGVYFMRRGTGEGAATRKLILLR